MSNEEVYFSALKRIAAYLPPERLRFSSEKLYGLEYREALEYAYENVINEARMATKGKRRPKAKQEPKP